MRLKEDKKISEKFKKFLEENNEDVRYGYIKIVAEERVLSAELSAKKVKIGIYRCSKGLEEYKDKDWQQKMVYKIKAIGFEYCGAAGGNGHYEKTFLAKFVV